MTDPRELRPLSEYRRCLVELAEVYARIPRIACQKRCHNSCTTTDASPLEHALVLERGVDLPPLIPVREIQRRKAAGRLPQCPALSALGLCRVYEVRPFICRVFGAAQVMPCEYGCEPERWLTTAEVAAMLLEIDEISARAMAARAREGGARQP